MKPKTSRKINAHIAAMETKRKIGRKKIEHTM
jgi:hypothetical protein